MIRIIRTLLFSLIVFFISAAHASFYVGAGLGPDAIDFKQQANIYQPGAFGFQVINKTHLSGTGVFGTVFIGYKYLQNKFHLAVEANSNISSASFTTSNDEYVHSNFQHSRYKINNSYGVSVLPGYQISENALFYARLGYANANVKISTTDSSLANKSHRRDGFRPGLGVNQQITKRLSVRMEYSRTQYTKTKLSAFDAMSLVTKNTTISPRQQLVEFSGIFQLD